jgi:bifunctional DNase/RNase
MEGFDEMVVYGVSYDVASRQPIVLLKSAEGNRFLPIWIGQPEAAAILMKLQDATFPRPMTHDLFTNVLGTLTAKLERVLVTELKENTFYAVIRLKTKDEEIDVDSRPSDAIALAVRSDAPIFAASDLLETNGIELEAEIEDEEDIVSEFRDFLDKVSPEDFSPPTEG